MQSENDFLRNNQLNESYISIETLNKIACQKIMKHHSRLYKVFCSVIRKKKFV
jgi:hypothetical protein